MSTILSVVIGLVVKDVLNWVSTNLTSWIAAYKATQAQHSSDASQTQQDMNPVESLPADPTAAQETEAGSDALNHL